jgi:hypothetical protein
MRYKEIIEDSLPSPAQPAVRPDRETLLKVARRKGYVVDSKDTSLTGGIEATPELVISAITDTADSLEVTDKTTPDDVHKWLWSE